MNNIALYRASYLQHKSIFSYQTSFSTNYKRNSSIAVFTRSHCAYVLRSLFPSNHCNYSNNSAEIETIKHLLRKLVPSPYSVILFSFFFFFTSWCYYATHLHGVMTNPIKMSVGFYFFFVVGGNDIKNKSNVLLCCSFSPSHKKKLIFPIIRICEVINVIQNISGASQA